MLPYAQTITAKCIKALPEIIIVDFVMKMMVTLGRLADVVDV